MDDIKNFLKALPTYTRESFVMREHVGELTYGERKFNVSRGMNGLGIMIEDGVKGILALKVQDLLEYLAKNFDKLMEELPDSKTKE